ncbi:MAG: hypothetical protein IPN43_11045 [Chitinophagaceae bacterium]|nr:hypothetical protein [Chitinophagaceae bacterium]
MSYDENGNITSLQRYAILGSTITQIDDLTYSYKNSNLSNQLDNIIDNIPGNTTGYGYRNFTGTTDVHPYSYDAGNGNLTGDLKKGTTITYNELNKPTLIQISSTKKVEYRYDAAGTRLSKVVTNNSTTKTIEYIGGYVIENDVLSYYGMAEGRVRNEGGGYGLSMKMEYFITDHQGNTRVSFEDNGTNTNTAHLTQENSYYAFGMQMAGSYMPTNANKKLYNAGSEWQDDIEGLADYYSTFYREYDPVIGRFNGVDPKSESFESWTTYHYSYNNPVNFNDPMGDRPAAGQSPMRDRIDQLDVLLTGDNFYGDYGSAGGGGRGDSRFSNAKELFEYISIMGPNSVNTSYGGLRADAWGVYDMSMSEVSSMWRYLGELGITSGYRNEKSSAPIVRKDGSRMFKNENEAYKWMYNQSISNNYREQFAIILTKSVLVLPDSKNSQSEVIPENYGYTWKDGNIVDPVTGKTLEVVATMHTHLIPSGYDPMPSYDDQRYSAKRMPNKPYLTMGHDGKIYGFYGRWQAAKDGLYYSRDIKTFQISFTRSPLPINNATVTKDFQLRNYLVNYMKTYFR